MPSTSGRISVLMVDDNPEHVQLCEESLPAEEFHMDGALTGKDALRLLDKNVYDIIVLDYALPDMSGLDLLRKIKAQGFHIPMVFVTAANDPDLSMRALQAGACDFIVKTFHYYSNLRGRLLENLEACSTSGRR